MSRQKASSTNEVRNHRISFFISDSEREMVESKLGQLSLREFFRRAGLGVKMPRNKPVPQVNRLIYMELARIGNNLNRLVEACNLAVQQGNSINIDVALIDKLMENLNQTRLELLGLNFEAEVDG